MTTHISIIVSLTLLGYVCSTKVLPSEVVKCPNVCHCYYLGINWQTDCSESNLMKIPLDGLDPNVYTLNLNTNRLSKIDTFQPNFKVKSLQLYHNSLTTIQKETFAGLQYLLDINLSSNLINYVHPEAFIENVVLITLQLQNNPLIPVDGPFLYSKTLRFLNLANCQLTALSHRFFTKINGLIKVDLSGNPLSIIEADVFDPLTTLKHLNLNNINLTNIVIVAQHNNVVVSPNAGKLESCGNWTLIVDKLLRLEHLELKQTGVSNLSENIFSNHIYLRHLVLAENQLTNSKLDITLGQNLINIDYLDLSYCNLKAPLSKYAFAKAPKLRTLILSGNYLSTSGLGVALSPLSKLAKLSLNNCRLTELSENTFQNLSSLKELDISMNPLNEYYSGAFSIINRLESLEHLNMSYTNMEIINIHTFSKMTSLKALILSGNKINSWASEFLKDLPHLLLLELNNCGLTYLDSTVFNGISSHPSLEELRVSRNPLEYNKQCDVPQYKIYFFQTFLPKLKSLDLSYCNLHYYSTFQHYTPSLRRLLLNNNKIKNKVDMYTLNNPAVLEYLDVSYNDFTSIAFHGMSYSHYMSDGSNLTSLKLIGNPWICDCTILSLWKWAKRGLIGSKYSIASNKEADSLVCQFDPSITPAEGLEQNKPCSEESSKVLRYTWARYVREFESICNCLQYIDGPKSSCRYDIEYILKSSLKKV